MNTPQKQTRSRAPSLEKKPIAYNEPSKEKKIQQRPKASLKRMFTVSEDQFNIIKYELELSKLYQEAVYKKREYKMAVKRYEDHYDKNKANKHPDFD